MKRLLLLFFCAALLFTLIPFGVVNGLADEEYPTLPSMDEGVDPNDMHMPMLDFSEEETPSFQPFALIPAKSYIQVMLSTHANEGAKNVQRVVFTGKYTLYIANSPKLVMQPGTAYYLVRISDGNIEVRQGSPSGALLAVGAPLEFKEGDNGNSPNSFALQNAPGASYLGDLICYNQSMRYSSNVIYSALFCVNRLYIEDYVKGVVPNEMNSTFSQEALKAQAIIARTYGAYRIKSGSNFDLWDNSLSQVYKGTSNSTANTNQAVNDTAGIVVTYNNKLIDATYSASNGGQTNLSSIRWTASYAYEELKVDPYDEKYILASMTQGNSYCEAVYFDKTYGPADGTVLNPKLTTLIKNALVPNLAGAAADGSNIVLSSLSMDYTPEDFGSGKQSTFIRTLNVKFTGTVGGTAFEQTVAIGYKDFYVKPDGKPPYGYFTNGKLSEYWLDDMGTQYRLRHSRFGHGVGMSQVGAEQMAREGQTAQQIIAFYYKNVVVDRSAEIGPKLPLSDTPSISTDYTVNFTLPQDVAQDYVLAVDGFEIPKDQITVDEGDVRFVLQNGGGKVLTVYNMKAHDTLIDTYYPTGMYVYMLDFLQTGYVASYVPEFKDLFSYHGFSVRISGKPGIRVINGVGSSVKSTLRAGGVNGYKLYEYGTLGMNGVDSKRYPLVLKGTGVFNPSKSYYTVNGSYYDTIFATENGRVQFTSVLVDLPAAAYASDMAFRPYMILQKGGTYVTIYGPMANRSIYNVAKQVIGIYSPGSSSHTFLKSITDYVEKP